MSNQYYLMAQLPSFAVSDDATPLPVTEQYFLDLCSRFLDKKSMKILSSLSLEPPREAKTTGSAFVDRWYNQERNLRLALAQIRAERMKKNLGTVPVAFPPDIVQAARTATGMDSPLSAEQFLNEYRVRLVDNIAPSDGFSCDAVFMYGLKLKLDTRMKKFNKEAGKAAYRMLYDEILGESK